MSDLAEITPCYTMRFQRRIAHSPARLWRAITDAAEVARWMGCPARVDLRVGGDYHVDFRDPEAGVLDGVIVRVRPERTLAYVWGVSVIEWALEPDAGGCRFQFAHHGMPPRDVEEEEGVAAGWHVWLDDLAAHIDGRGPGRDDESRRWSALLPPYRERVAAVLGGKPTGGRRAASRRRAKAGPRKAD